MINNMLLASNTTLKVLLVFVIAFAVLTFVAWIVACCTKIYVYIMYKKYNKILTTQNIDSKTNTEYLLKNKNLENVKVQKCGFWRSLFGFDLQGFGNSYSPRKKTIFLRKNIIDKSTITAIGVSSQRVGQAVLDKEVDKQFKIVSKLRPFYAFAPLLFLPIILVFAILDIFVFKTEGITFCAGALFAFVYLIGALTMLFLTIPSEKKANKIALESLKASGLYTDDEIAGMEIVLNSYIKSYVSDFVYAVVEVIFEVLKLIFKLVVNNK